MKKSGRLGENKNMAMFGRKKDEDIEDEDDFEEEEGGNRKFTKKFKDLNPENKKKRKEPVKPWGKKERTIILVILLATVIISAILSFSTTFKIKFSDIRLEMPKFSLNSLNIFKGETIIIEK
jgi:hypothetical protein